MPEDTADAVVVTGDSVTTFEPATAIAPPSSAIFAVALAGVGAFLNLYVTQPVLPLLEQLFHASKAAVGMTVSAATLGVAFSAPLCGVLAERLGRRRVITTSMLILSVPTLLAATAPSLPLLVFWRLLQGAIMPGIFGVTIAFVAEEWPVEQMARVMSIYVSGTVFGGFLSRFLGGLAATHTIFGIRPSWRNGFVLIGALDLLFGVLIAQWLPPDRAGAHAASTSAIRGMLRHLRNPQLVATCVVGFNILFSLVATFTYITFHLAAAPYSMTAAHLSWLFAVYLVGLVVTPIGGVFIARFGSRIALMTAVAASMTGVLLTLTSPLAVIVVGLILCSSGVFVCQAASTSYIHRAAPPGGRSSAAGLYVASYYIGGSVAGVVPGWLWRFGGWTACVILIVVVQAATITIAGMTWRDAR
ncbi:MAG TPA: MFS transporter [Thermoanaerobaculia bacterium]